MRLVVWAYLEELVQEEREPVGQHLLSNRLRSDVWGEGKEEKQTQSMKNVNKLWTNIIKHIAST